MSARRAVLVGSLLTGLLGAACGSSGRPVVSAPPASASSVASAPASSASVALETPDEAFRRQPPLPGPEGTFQAPVPADVKLPNGMRVILLENHAMPLVAMAVVLRRGSSAGAAGAMLGPMMLQGTPGRDVSALSEAFEALGARYRVVADDDATVVAATVLAPEAGAALDLLADVVQRPTLPATELDRLRSRRLLALAAEADLPRVVLQRAVAELLYPAGHPYRVSARPDEAALRALQRSDLVRLHGELRPDRSSLVVAGDVTREQLMAAATRAFGGWRGRSGPLLTPATPKPGKPHVLLVDLPGAPQTSIAVAAVGARRGSPDHDALLVLNTLLSRRLNANLRGRHAYTYGASAQFTFRQGPGPFMAGGDVAREHTADAVREVLAEFERLRDNPVGHDELAEVKTIVGALSARFESVEASVVALTPLAVHDLEDSEFLTLRVRLQMVTREVLQKVAQTYLAPGRLQLALVGDAASIEAPVRSLDFGPVEVRRASSTPRPAPPLPLDPGGDE